MLRLLTIFLLLSARLCAQVETVTIKWTPGLCLESCVNQLQSQFMRIPGVDQANIDQGTAQAVLLWRPDAPFSFTAVKNAMAMIGLKIHDIRLKVTGTITHDQLNIILVSEGDGSHFTLLGPVTPRPSQQVVQYNVETHSLSPDRKEQLLQSEIDQNTVTIEGPLFMPFRSPPYLLILEKMKVNRS